MVKKKNRWLWPVIGAGVLLLLAVRQLPLYESAEAQPFEGPYWYNPYEQVNGAGRWLRANFHAHSNAWGFVTNGRKNTVADVLQTYDSLGYDVIGISDYQHITLKHGVWENERTGRSMLLIPAYEHGYNIRKTHQGVIGAWKVYGNDYLLPQTLSQKQHVINKLKERGRLVVLHHPDWMGGYNQRDMRVLTGYDLFEVLNDFWISEDLWDTALSAGRPAMLLAGDDAHNVFKPTDIARDFIMIFAEAEGGEREKETALLAAEGVYRALETGAAYGVEVTERLAYGTTAQKRAGLDALPVLESCRIYGDTLKVVLSGRALWFRFIGQDGRVLGQNGRVLVERNGSGDSAFYVLGEEDTYVRVKICLPDSTHLYLNPVMRTKVKGEKPPMPEIRKRRLFTIFGHD
ncbi:MAG: hypothetical protein WBK97_07490 [Bacteroidales bacterium]